MFDHRVPGTQMRLTPYIRSIYISKRSLTVVVFEGVISKKKKKKENTVKQWVNNGVERN